MKYFRRWSGPDVYLSPANPEDTELFTKWVNDPELRYLLGGSRHYSLTAEREFMEGAAKNPNFFVIVRGDDDTPIGSLDLREIDTQNRTASAGIMICDAENQGKGYGAQAMALLCAYGFDALNLMNIQLGVFDFNLRAQRCYEKVGFKRIGVRRECYYARGRYHDKIFMDLLREDLNRALIAPGEGKA